MIDSDDTPDVIVWPPLMALGTLIFGFALDRIAPTFLLRVISPFELRVLIALFLVSGGAALATVARQEFLQMGTNVAPSQPALRLVTTGIYAHVRNPMYVALGLFVAGVGVGFACDCIANPVLGHSLSVTVPVGAGMDGGRHTKARRLNGGQSKASASAVVKP